MSENAPGPGVVTEEEQQTETRLSPPWNVVVHDDPINLMVYVTHVFMRIFGYPRPKAETLMLEVHHRGRAVVWTGEREQAELYAVKLHAAHLSATLERVDA
jgi:ATP-dependent Clp protease adaptor protein ClpS